MADNDRRQGLFGNPYVGWSPRPAKNGQPPPCYGQCNLNIGGRKVGAAMKRLPQLYYGDKAKEQILQKWDPTTKSIVNIHHRDASPPLDNTPPTVISASFVIQGVSTASVNWVLNKNAACNVRIIQYYNGNPTGFDTQLIMAPSGTTNITYNVPSEHILDWLFNTTTGYSYHIRIYPAGGSMYELIVNY